MFLQEMDATAFKDFSSHEWHIGVVSDVKLETLACLWSHLFKFLVVSPWIDEA